MPPAGTFVKHYYGMDMPHILYKAEGNEIMLTSKQRAYLRGIAAKEDTIFQVGKGGIGENLIDQVRDALKAREIVKIKVLDAAMLSAAEAAEALAEGTKSEVVQVIGNKLTLFKRNPQEPKIELPSSNKKK